MSLSNSAVAERFAARKRGNGGNMSTDGVNLYSYRAVIATWLGDTPIINGDRFSITTSSHQGDVRRSVGWDKPTVSFSALSGAGLVSFRDGFKDGVKLVSYTPDLHESAYEDDLAYETILKNAPIGATTYDRNDRGDKVRGYHRAGTVVFRYGKHDYLCGFDEGSYFVSKLPRRVKTVEDAYLALMPKEVIGKEFLRQGEWFFVPTCNEGRSFNAFIKANRYPYRHGDHTLPRLNAGSNPHIVTYLEVKGKRILAAGTVRHPQHRMLRLAKGVIYQAYRNRSKGDWSAQGRVD